MATIGQALTIPETGWRRYDNTDSRIIYDSNSIWSTSTSYANAYNLSYKQSNTINSNIQFCFYGTKLRILSNYATDKSDNIEIFIDGISKGIFSEYATSVLYQTIVYEILNLTNQIHTIKLVNNKSNYIMLDAIDIDSAGYLIHPTLNQVNSLDDMQVGDCIPCRYTATTSGQAGYFSELGTCTANEIPIAGTATPDGLFYLIKTAKGTLIADRVIQTNISWDTLNTAKYIEGVLNSSTTSIATPPMTSKNTPSGIVLAGFNYNNIDSGMYSAFNAFDGKASRDYYGWSNVPIDENTWIYYKFTTPKTLLKYGLKPVQALSSSYMAKSWKLEGSNNSVAWDVLDVQTNQTSWKSSEIRYFDISNPKNYLYYRITILSNNGASLVSIGKIYYMENNIFKNTSIRSLSGGCAYANANGNSSTTDKGLGAWPPNNEWDTYIVNSDLGGKITKGDNNIWHYINVTSPVRTWFKDTPITSIFANTGRVTRPQSASLDMYSWSYNYSDTINTTIGFRPVLEYLEPNSKATNLFY